MMYLQPSTSPVNITELLNTITMIDHRWVLGTQQDAHEMITWLLEKIHNEAPEKDLVLMEDDESEAVQA